MADDENPEEQGPADEGGESPDFKYIVRIANTDLDGAKQVQLALARIKGIGDRLASIVTDEVSVARTARIGDLSDEQIEELSEAVNNIADMVPDWMLNRRKDVATGDDLHLLRTELESELRADLNRLKKIRSYRGVRHEQGQKVRGQRTRANGRHGLAMGVSRKKE